MKNNPDKIKDVDKKGKELDEKRRLLESEIQKLNEKNLRKKTAEGEFKTLGLDNLESDKKRMSEALKEKTVDIKKQGKIVKESKVKLEKIGFNENDSINYMWISCYWKNLYSKMSFWLFE